MYSKNLNKDSPQTAELLNIIPSSRLIQSWENPPADIFLLQSSFFNYSSRSITILQKQKRKTKKHNSATYVSFLIFSYFSMHLYMFKLCQSTLVLLLDQLYSSYNEQLTYSGCCYQWQTCRKLQKMGFNSQWCVGGSIWTVPQ